jgi:hypothetical protein
MDRTKHEIYKLNSAKMLFFINDLHELKGKFDFHLWKVIAAIIDSFCPADTKAILELISHLEMIQEPWQQAKKPGNTISSDLLINSIYFLMRKRYPRLIKQVLKSDIMKLLIDFYKKKWDEISNGEKLKFADTVVLFNTFPLSFVEKYKPEFFETLKQDIFWGYIDQKQVIELLNTPIPISMELYTQGVGHIAVPMSDQDNLSSSSSSTMSEPMLNAYNQSVNQSNASAQSLNLVPGIPNLNNK